jgi:hypothetical protein
MALFVDRKICKICLGRGKRIIVMSSTETITSRGVGDVNVIVNFTNVVIRFLQLQMFI